jgi:hypothetical protein
LSRTAVFNVIVIVLEVVANIIFWRVLGPLERAAARMSSGEAVDEEERKRARNAGYRATFVILSVILVAFVIGPIGGIIGNQARA